MERLEVKEIEVLQNWHWAKNNGSIATYKYSMISWKDVENFKQHIRDIPRRKGFVDGDKVFLDKTVIIPRNKFKKDFKNIKVVYDIADANVLVISENAVNSLTPSYKNTFYLNKDNKFAAEKDTEYITPFEASTYFRDISLDRCNTLISAKNIMDPKYIGSKSEEILDDEAYKRLEDMLKSSDIAMSQLGMNLLTAYNYDRDKYRLALLYKENSSRWVNDRKKKISIELKALLHKMNGEFTFYDNTRFYFMLLRANPEDQLIADRFKKFTKDYLHLQDGEYIKLLKE